MKYIRAVKGTLIKDFHITPSLCIHKYDWNYLDIDIIIVFLRWYIGINICNKDSHGISVRNLYFYIRCRIDGLIINRKLRVMKKHKLSGNVNQVSIFGKKKNKHGKRGE